MATRPDRPALNLGDLATLAPVDVAFDRVRLAATGRAWTLAALLIVLIGALLRLYALSAMEFKYDEQEALNLGIHLIDERQWASPSTWPRHGMPSSNNVANAPLFTWIVGAAWGLTRHPVPVAGLVAIVNTLCLFPLWRWARRRMDEPRALIMLALCAFSPFAVIFSRKIWTQDLLLPGVLAVLWGIEWLRGGRTGRGLLCLLAALLLAGQLHQSGPIALALLPLAVAIQLLADRRRGLDVWRLVRPTPAEAAGMTALVLLNLCFWLPYLEYLWHLPAEVLAARPRTEDIWPHLLNRVGAQVRPTDLFFFFEPHRDEFLAGRVRLNFYEAAVFLGTPLYVYGLARWLWSPLSLPVIGVWWACIIAAFSLARIPTWPFYVLILAPLPAVLAAGGLEGPGTTRIWINRLLTLWRVAYVAATLGLTVSTLAWLTARGGAAGDYGVAFSVRERQARSILQRLGSRAVAGGPTDGHANDELMPDQASALRECQPPPGELQWIVHWLDPGQPPLPPQMQLCEGWLRQGPRRVYRWAVRD